MNDRARLLAVILNAAALVAIVVLQDPELRRQVAEGWRNLTTAAAASYHRSEPSAGEVSALHAEARAIIEGEQ